MTKYVVGFMTDTKGRVALIRKARPEWQYGKLNGIGGKIEPGEVPEIAMVREFKEETGADTTVTQWWPFAILSGDWGQVHFFTTRGDLSSLKTMTDEEIVIIPISDVTLHNSVPNTTWLLPMGLSIIRESPYYFKITEEY